MPTMMRATLAACFLTLAAAPLTADVVIVFEDGSGDYTTIQEALDAVSDFDQIYVGPGTYKGPGNRQLQFYGKKVSITGWFGDEPTIDCEGLGPAMYLDSDIDTTCIIERLNFVNGTVSGRGGGAIDCDHAGPIIRDCRFFDNSGTDGGAIRVNGEPAPRIRNCRFWRNHAGYGGAMSVADASVAIYGCTFYRNYAEHGGALYFSGGAPKIEKVTLCLNWATVLGSAIEFDTSSATISRCIVAFNDLGHPIYGGATSETFYSCIFGNMGGNDLEGNHHDNYYDDPLLCDIYLDDYHLCQNSYCLPGGNPWHVQIGHQTQNCGPCDSPVDDTSWGAIKALYR